MKPEKFAFDTEFDKNGQILREGESYKRFFTQDDIDAARMWGVEEGRMSSQLPILLFLVPFAAAVAMPLLFAKRRSWCKPLTTGAVRSPRGEWGTGSFVHTTTDPLA